MALQERSELDRVAQARAQVVARGVSAPALVVDRAQGALIRDADGREYIERIAPATILEHALGGS